MEHNLMAYRRVKEQRRAWHRVLVVVGACGPLGFLPASGSITVACVGVPMFYWMHTWAPGLYILVVAIFTLLSVALHHVGDQVLQEKDSRVLVWDELVGFMVGVALVPFTWQLALTAFVLERGLDILKIPPAHWIEHRVPGGWGVVGDDIIAGLYTCVILHVALWLVPRFLGVAH